MFLSFDLSLGSCWHLYCPLNLILWVQNVGDSLSCNRFACIERALCVVSGDINNFDTCSMVSLGLTKPMNVQTLMNENDGCNFYVQKRAHMSTSDHSILLFFRNVMTNPIIVEIFLGGFDDLFVVENVFFQILLRLIDTVETTDFVVLTSDSPSAYCDHMTCCLYIVSISVVQRKTYSLKQKSFLHHNSKSFARNKYKLISFAPEVPVNDWHCRRKL